MQQKRNNKAGSDRVVAVGQVEDATVQVLQPFPDVEKFTWRIIRDNGRSVASSMVSYTSLEQAMGAALMIVLPDAVPVEYTEPSQEDFEALNIMLFGFKKGEPVTTFQEALTAHAFLVQTLEVLDQAKQKMPVDFDDIATAMAKNSEIDYRLVETLRALQELTLQTHDVMIELCMRDRDTLAQFIHEFLIL